MRKAMMLLLLMSGCDGVGPGHTTSAPNPGTACPATRPHAGDACQFAAPYCYYFDACTQDGMGITAACQGGHVQMGYDLILALCPMTAPVAGSACPCVDGGRQEQPCDYACAEGGQLQATCDAQTATWKVAAPSACTPGSKI